MEKGHKTGGKDLESGTREKGVGCRSNSTVLRVPTVLSIDEEGDEFSRSRECGVVDVCVCMRVRLFV